MIVNKIREAREAQNITQGKLAEMVGISRVALSRIENSDHPTMYAETAYKLAKALNVSMESFFCEEC